MKPTLDLTILTDLTVCMYNAGICHEQLFLPDEALQNFSYCLALLRMLPMWHPFKDYLEKVSSISCSSGQDSSWSPAGSSGKGGDRNADAKAAGAGERVGDELDLMSFSDFLVRLRSRRRNHQDSCISSESAGEGGEERGRGGGGWEESERQPKEEEK